MDAHNVFNTDEDTKLLYYIGNRNIIYFDDDKYENTMKVIVTKTPSFIKCLKQVKKQRILDIKSNQYGKPLVDTNIFQIDYDIGIYRYENGGIIEWVNIYEDYYVERESNPFDYYDIISPKLIKTVKFDKTDADIRFEETIKNFLNKL